MEEEQPRVLCVDDETAVLKGLERTLFEHFDVTTASSPKEGLVLIEEDGPFAVIVSDMRMPEMNGAEFLSAVRSCAPESVRILLTGQSDLESAIKAVNEGAIFRFLSKPCKAPLLIGTLTEAAEQYRLLRLEKTLLADTLGGAVRTMVKLLEIVAPVAFRKSAAMNEFVAHVGRAMKLEHAWVYETAASLSQAGHLALPTDTLDKLDRNHELTVDEEEMVSGAFATAESLISEIPRLERVAAIVGALGRPPSQRGSDDPLVERGIRLLVAADQLDRAQRSGEKVSEAARCLRGIDAATKAAFATFSSSNVAKQHVLHLTDCRPGMVLDQDVRTKTGLRLAREASKLSPALLQRLRNFDRTQGIVQPIRVIVQ